MKSMMASMEDEEEQDLADLYLRQTARLQERDLDLADEMGSNFGDDQSDDMEKRYSRFFENEASENDDEY